MSVAWGEWRFAGVAGRVDEVDSGSVVLLFVLNTDMVLGDVDDLEVEMNVVVQQVFCDDPAHGHHSPIQNMVGFELNEHWVEVTQDGDFYKVRIDKDDASVRNELCDTEAGFYIKEMTEVCNVR